ncbi:unnamed protein product [Ilex paraguariensis]|uniref:Uncharacterized protein n=1 Tax=Ilex paraguariensis TaxID=185542 RepID=A0ABC8TMW6_9AQUA
MLASQGLVVGGGGERKGIEGNVVGMVGIEGMVGREVAGSGGSDTFGMVGSGGIWVAGIGGNVGFGRIGTVGSVGIAGSGGNVDLGRDGNVGSVGAEVCKRLRAPKLIWILDKIRIKERMEE